MILPRIVAVTATCVSAACAHYIEEPRSSGTVEFIRVHRGSQAAQSLGSAVCSVGDWDGDGRADYALGRRQHVEVVSGASGETILRLDPSPGTVGFVASLRALPDLDGDGRLDLAVGVAGDASGFPEPGANARSGVVELRASADSRILRTLRSERPSSEFGWALAVLENLSVPLQSLLLVAERDDRADGRVHSSACVFDLRDGTPAFRIDGTEDSWNQWDPANCGDLDGDGFSDFAIGGDRTVTLVSGRNGRVLRTMDLAHGGHPIPSDDKFDLDRDGTPDVAVAEHVFDPMRTDGAVEVFSGRDGHPIWSARCLAFDGALVRVDDAPNDAFLAITGSASVTFFAPPSTEPVRSLSLQPMSAARLVRIGDVDADGRQDLAVVDSSDGGHVGIVSSRTLHEVIRR